MAATFWAFPEIRRGWWAATALVNPALVIAPIIGQLPFIWGAAMLMAAIGCWRRQRYVEAAVLAGLGQATHPAVVLPIALLLVLGGLKWEQDKRRLLKFYAISLVIALPAMWIVFVSPVFVDSSTLVIIGQFFGTFVVRAFVFVRPDPAVVLPARSAADPVAVAPDRRSSSSHWASTSPSATCSTPATHGAPCNRKPDTDLLQFVNSPNFEPGKTVPNHSGR